MQHHSRFIIHKYDIEISGLIYELHTEYEIHISHNFAPFMRENPGSVDCTAELVPVNDFHLAEGKMLYEDYDSQVILQTSGIIARNYFRYGNKYYAFSLERKAGESTVVYYEEERNGKKQYLPDMNQCFHMIGWEKMLAYHNRMILHASCIQTQLGGILFSGPSGMGKSTQADLWQKYRGAELINGDRVVLYKKEKWRGYGSPFAGSSNCHKDKSVEIRAIIVLRQAESNTIRRLNTAQAFHRLYSEMTVYLWDKDFVVNAVDLTMQLAAEVPVYELACRPDEEAVITVENELRKGLQNGKE